ncbi:MAG: YibE/F family protein [Actinobacteria bacterium]|nr:YibE/F family protein [Actinomycetota bacterium]
MGRKDKSLNKQIHIHNHASVRSSMDFDGRRLTIFRWLFVLTALAGFATIVGLVALWPDGRGQEDIKENALKIGLVSELLNATVEEVEDSVCSYSISGEIECCRNVLITVHEGSEAGSLVALPEVNTSFDRTFPKLSVGEDIIVGYHQDINSYYYEDRDRRTSLWWLALLFAVFVVCLARTRGLLALVAMAGTVLVLVKFVAPSVLDGNDPVLVCVVAAALIAFFSLYLTHGFTVMTTVALAGTLIALGFTLGISWIFFELASFSGFSSEESLVLPLLSESLDLRGLLLGGTIIAALGALDDVTVTQAATVLELSAQNSQMSASQLVRSGLKIGREHIASTVNTLLLAYVGSSIPLLLLFAVSDQPLGLVANSELISIEIVRTLCGSIGLVAALPLTTFLAAFLVRSAARTTLNDRDNRTE